MLTAVQFPQLLLGLSQVSSFPLRPFQVHATGVSVTNIPNTVLLFCSCPLRSSGASLFSYPSSVAHLTACVSLSGLLVLSVWVPPAGISLTTPGEPLPTGRPKHFWDLTQSRCSQTVRPNVVSFFTLRVGTERPLEMLKEELSVNHL